MTTNVSLPIPLFKLPPHPAAEYFPLLTGDAFERLKANIADVGLLNPITTCDGKILDGRNRYDACLQLGIEPRFQPFEGDSPVTAAWALNAERRHLSASQRAAIAAKLLEPLKAEAKRRQERTSTHAPRNANGHLQPATVPETAQPVKGRAIEQAARLVGVGKTIVRRALEVRNADPVAFDAIAAGTTTVEEAHRAVVKRETFIPLIPPPSKVAASSSVTKIRGRRINNPTRVFKAWTEQVAAAVLAIESHENMGKTEFTADEATALYELLAESMDCLEWQMTAFEKAYPHVVHS